MSKFVRGNYFRVSNHIFRFHLRPITFLVYCFLQKCDNAVNGCYPSKSYVAEQCGISDSSVDKALHELKKAHLISVEHQYTHDGRQTSNRYKLYDIEEQFRKVFCAEELETESEKELRERYPELFEDVELP